MMGEISESSIGIDAFVYGIYAALIPLNMIMNFSGSTVNKQIGIIASGLMLLVIFLKNNIRKISDINWPLFLFVVFSSLSVLWSDYYSTSKTAMITLVSLYLTFSVGKARKFNNREVLTIFSIMAIASMIIPFYLGINYATSYSRLTLSNENGSADQNGLACNMAFVAIIVFSIFISKNKSVVKYFFLAAFGSISIGIVLTGSRTAIIGTCLAIMYYLIKMFPELKKNKTLIRTMAVISLLIVLSLYYFSNNLSDSIINRLSFDGMTQDAGSGRLEIWQNIIAIIVHDPLHFIFGYGFGTQAEMYNIYYNSRSVAHSVFFQLFLEVGLIGMLLFIMALLKTWIYAYKKKCHLANALLLMLLFTYSTLAFTTNKGGWNVFMLVYSISGLQINVSENNCTNKGKDHNNE